MGTFFAKLTWRKKPEIRPEGSECGHGQRHLVTAATSKDSTSVVHIINLHRSRSKLSLDERRCTMGCTLTLEPSGPGSDTRYCIFSEETLWLPNLIDSDAAKIGDSNGLTMLIEPILYWLVLQKLSFFLLASVAAEEELFSCASFIIFLKLNKGSLFFCLIRKETLLIICQVKHYFIDC